MKKVCIILTLLIPLLSRGQSLPTKKEQYDFLKWYIKYKKLENVALSDTTTLLAFNKAGVTEFTRVLSASNELSKTNIYYLKKQLTNKIFPIDKNEFPHVRWRINYDPDSLSTHISLPAFSIDKSLAFIHYAYYCGGTCGTDRTEVYQKSLNGIWLPSKLPFNFTYLKY